MTVDLPSIILQILPQALLATAVALLVLAVSGWWTARAEISRRLAARTETAGTASLRYGEMPALFKRAMAPVEARLAAGGGARRLMLQAGFPSPHAVSLYFACRLGLAALALAALPLLGGRLPGGTLVLAGLGLAGFGYMLPALWVARRRAARQQRCREGFPDALDLLLVCVEAGLGLDSAIARVGEEIGVAHPLLAGHFRLAALELRAGASREAALANFAERIGIDEIATLVALLSETAALGASVGDALRVHAEDLRAYRMLRAEEKAQELGVRLSLPLVGLILPSLLAIIAAPAMIRVRDAIHNMHGGPSP
jgi:tight adherence protein C